MTAPTEETCTLIEEASMTLEEVRMVVPGIQAILGFQLIAVFSDRYMELELAERALHLASLLLVALAMALIMAPAAYHRMAESGRVTRHFISLASRFLAWAMGALALGLTVEIYLVSELTLGHPWAGFPIAAVALALFGWFWFVLPLKRARR